MSEELIELFEQGLIGIGIWETIYMTALSTVIAYVLGLPLGILLNITDKDGLTPVVWLNKSISVIVNILRSIPFIIMMVAFLPVAKFLVGTSIGNPAMIVMLVIAATPYVARMVESSLKEVNKGVIEAAKSMGASNFKIIIKVILPEALPSLIVGAVISTVTIVGYVAMASTIGAGGLGKIAIVNGYSRFNQDVIWVSVFFIVIIVQVIQEAGMFLAKSIDKRIIGKSGKAFFCSKPKRTKADNNL